MAAAAEMHRLWLWWRRKGREYRVGAAWTAAFLFALAITVGLWLDGGDDHRRPIGGPVPVGLTLLRNAKQRGAVCLDGGSPGYHLQKGFGSGSNKWVLHIEGGGWCNTIESCSSRKMTQLGSSNYMDAQFFSGILSDDRAQNPDFFNWNKVKIRYCDGGSFSGNAEINQNGTILFFRGKYIWEALMDELLSAGLAYAKQALLSGCSAGGLATLIHCDDFRELLPKGVVVKCLVDAGFFLDIKDISGRSTIQSFYSDVVNLQGIAKNLNKDCISKVDPSQARFRTAMLDAFKDLQKEKDVGLFVDSCYVHCQTWMSKTWHSPDSPRINNKCTEVIESKQKAYNPAFLRTEPPYPTLWSLVK
ncbi:hypothetical protein QJS04_geneDACA021550 [Acorus gramineus]|uniref:Pectin acetylesterase n=1 Tax=Acorus gramineus TaxID=55184 RepID=A0AAV9B2Q0_ACOGR|nr:hypothetical protein QJS04_geneDACA021550 [Acorus gramineus]